jgi:hypothetical protein
MEREPGNLFAWNSVPGRNPGEKLLAGIEERLEAISRNRRHVPALVPGFCRTPKNYKHVRD